MKKITICLILSTMMLVMCKPAKESEVCGTTIKDFNFGVVTGKIENGCVAKYKDLNEYMVKGGESSIIVAPGTENTTLHLRIGKVITKGGTFVIKDDNQVKVRMISGAGSCILGAKNVDLQVNSVLTLGQ